MVIHLIQFTHRDTNKESSKSSGTILWGLWLSLQNFMATHPIIISLWTEVLHEQTTKGGSYLQTPTASMSNMLHLSLTSLSNVSLVYAEPVFSHCGSSKRDVQSCPHTPAIITQQLSSSNFHAALTALLISLTLSGWFCHQLSCFSLCLNTFYPALCLRCCGLKAAWPEDVVFKMASLVRVCVCELDSRACIYTTQWNSVYSWEEEPLMCVETCAGEKKENDFV